MAATTVRGVRSPLSTRLAREIRAEMGRQGISSAALARKLGVSEAWTSRRISITGDQTMGVDDLERIADALGVDVLDLIPGGTVRPNRRSDAVPVRPMSPPRRREVSRPKGRPDAKQAGPQSGVTANKRRPQVIRSASRRIAA